MRRMTSIRNIWEKLKISIGSDDTRKSSGGGGRGRAKHLRWGGGCKGVFRGKFHKKSVK